MSLFKKFGRKFGLNRTTTRAAVSEGTASGSGSPRQEPLGSEASKYRDAQRNSGLEESSPERNQISISGGTFNTIGRDLIHNHNQFFAEEPSDIKLFEILNPVPAAHDCEVVNSKISECFAGTRQQLLHDLRVWRATGSVPIYILDGIAGIGKSTILKSFCTETDALRCLAGSWFFSRDEQDRKTTRGFVRTLAYQLAAHHPILRDRITQVLKAQPDILQKAIRMQFEALIHEPLQGVFENESESHTISIDAMDECILTEAVELLSMLLNMIPQHPGLRLLVTCRPEEPFRRLLKRHQGHRVFHLHEIENSVTEADIRLYINHRLSPEQIDEALPELLPPRWRASSEEKEALARMAGKLFIVASTAINFILDPRRMAPAKQMARLLDAQRGAGLASSSMDRLYVQVLQAAVPDPVDDWFDDYQAVVGSIIVAADVLSIQCLASLLDMDPNGIVSTLSHLHSLIAPTRENDAFHVHHKSFPDFVTDQTRCSIDPRFFIEASERHFHLAKHCLRIMIKILKENILDLPRSEWNTESSRLPTSTKERIPPALAYACGYWIFHMQEGLPHLVGCDDVVEQLKIFVDQHLLSWLEVLAWTNRFDTVWGDVSLFSERIQSLHIASKGPSSALAYIGNVLYDLLRFVSLHPELPRTLPMHIYLSVLPFAPSESKIRQLYPGRSKTTKSLSVVAGLEEYWDPVSATIHESRAIIATDLSPCGTIIATRTDRLRLYNAKSGQQLRSFELGMLSISSIAFSSDSRWIAASTADGVQIWDVVSGELVGSCPFPQPSIESLDVSAPGYPLDSEEGKNDASNPNELHATSLIFTPDGSSIAAGTVDGRVFLWQIGEHQAVLLLADRSFNHPCECLPTETLAWCRSHCITSLVACPDSPIVVGVTRDAVQFWDRVTLKTLKGISRCEEGHDIGPVSPSADNKTLAIDCDPSVISIYSIHTQQHLCNLSGHQGRITTTVFGRQDHRLCSASEDMTVRLWDVATATQLKLIPIPYVMMHSVFSVTLDTFILSPPAYIRSRMVRLAQDKCVVFGPCHWQGRPQLAAGGSTMASYLYESVMIANVRDFVDTGGLTNSFEPSQTIIFGHRISGEVVALYFGDDLESPLKASEGTASLNLIVKRSKFRNISHDMSRVAMIDDSSLLIYDACCWKQEKCYSLPLPLGAGDEPQGYDYVHFSWDSTTVYLQGQDSRLYFARLPPVSEVHQDESSIQLMFSEIHDTPRTHLEYPQAHGLPHALQHHFIGEDSVWVWLNKEKIWTQMHPPSLSFDKISKIAYSPTGEFIAIAISHGGISIQIRSLPDYELIDTVQDHQYSDWLEELRFIDHLPHILVAMSHNRLTCWDAKARQRLGNVSSLLHLGSLKSIHAYSGSNFLCLMKTPTASLALVAIHVRGPDLPEAVVYQQVCFFPPHLSILPRMSANPLRPYLVALSAHNGIIQIDISNCPLPFTL